MSSSSFIFVATALVVLIHLSQPSFTSGREMPPSPSPSPAALSANETLSLLLANGTCNMNFGSCVSVFKGLIHWDDGNVTAGGECCSIVNGMFSYHSAWCMCTKFTGDFFGFKYEVPVSISMVFNFCNKKIPENFACP